MSIPFHYIQYKKKENHFFEEEEEQKNTLLISQNQNQIFSKFIQF